MMQEGDLFNIDNLKVDAADVKAPSRQTNECAQRSICPSTGRVGAQAMRSEAPQHLQGCHLSPTPALEVARQTDPVSKCRLKVDECRS